MIMALVVVDAPFNTLTVEHINNVGYVGLQHTSIFFQPFSLCVKSQSARKKKLIRAEAVNNTLITETRKTIEECEEVVIEGNPPAPPAVPPKPQSPPGTLAISPIPLMRRPRRNCKSSTLRATFQETTLSMANYILPLFIHEGEEDTPIGAMPGCYRLGWHHGLIEEV
jgi:porphobilinogen synthase